MKRGWPDSDKLIATPSEGRKIVDELSLPIRKSWGQNFLIDAQLVRKIVAAAEIRPSEHVLEIGPGLGAMSQLLAHEAASLILVELDPLLVKHLNEYFSRADHVEVLHQDALTLDLQSYMNSKQIKHLKIVANLPYYITSPLLMHLLGAGISWQLMVLMMQKEVAQRIMATPGSKNWGALSLAVQYRAHVEKLFVVSPTAFMPQPQVDSMVVRLRKLSQPAVAVCNERLMFSLISAAFAQRRKTILNALSNGPWKGDKDFWRSCLDSVSIDSKRRGETLSLEEFAALTDAVEKHQL
ncbi:MAG: 16S rRNA (adenine(1518)-N(6)/adenine(1519)-N(6))-dimethyltransferase RsmA [Bacillota bacterium]